MEENRDPKRINFITIDANKISFGRNNFIEVARKKAVTDEGENEFISISRGYYLPAFPSPGGTTSQMEVSGSRSPSPSPTRRT